MIANSFTLTLQNRFEVLQQENATNSVNDTFNNFVSSCEEAAKENIPLKKKIKKRVPWENEYVSQNRENLKEMTKLKNTNPNPENIHNFNLAKVAL